MFCLIELLLQKLFKNNVESEYKYLYVSKFSFMSLGIKTSRRVIEKINILAYEKERVNKRKKISFMTIMCC